MPPATTAVKSSCGASVRTPTPARAPCPRGPRARLPHHRIAEAQDPRKPDSEKNCRSGLLGDASSAKCGRSCSAAVVIGHEGGPRLARRLAEIDRGEHHDERRVLQEVAVLADDPRGCTRRCRAMGCALTDHIGRKRPVVGEPMAGVGGLAVGCRRRCCEGAVAGGLASAASAWIDGVGHRSGDLKSAQQHDEEQAPSLARAGSEPGQRCVVAHASKLWFLATSMSRRGRKRGSRMGRIKLLWPLAWRRVRQSLGVGEAPPALAARGGRAGVGWRGVASLPTTSALSSSSAALSACRCRSVPTLLKSCRPRPREAATRKTPPAAPRPTATRFRQGRVARARASRSPRAMVLGAATGRRSVPSAGMTPMARTLSAPRKSVAGVARSVATKAERVIVAARAAASRRIVLGGLFGCQFHTHTRSVWRLKQLARRASTLDPADRSALSLTLALRNSPTSAPARERSDRMDSITHSHRRHRDDVRSKLQHADAAHATTHALRTWRSRTSATPAAALEPYTAPAASPAGFVRRNSWSLDDALSWVDDPLRRSTLVFGSNDERLHELYEALRQQHENRQPLPSLLSPAVLNALTSEAAARHFEPRRRAPERHAPRTPPRPLQIHAGWRAPCPPRRRRRRPASSPTPTPATPATATSTATRSAPPRPRRPSPPPPSLTAGSRSPPPPPTAARSEWPATPPPLAARAGGARRGQCARRHLRRRARAARAAAGAPPRRPSCSGGCRRGATRWCAVDSVAWRAAVARRDRPEPRPQVSAALGRAMRRWRGAVAAPLHLLNARARRRLAWAVARWVPEAAARRRRRDIAGRAVRRLRHAEAWRAFATLKAAHGRRRAALALATRALRAWVGRRRMRALSAWKAAVAERRLGCARARRRRRRPSVAAACAPRCSAGAT